MANQSIVRWIIKATPAAAMVGKEPSERAQHGWDRRWERAMTQSTNKRVRSLITLLAQSELEDQERECQR